MLQFYFFSIVLNFLSGLVLIFMGSEKNELCIFQTKVSRLILGIATFVVGFFKLISVIRTDILIVGDLLPALFGLLAGFTLLLDYYVHETSSEIPVTHGFLAFFTTGQKYIGIGAIIFAVLHLLFPYVPFL